MLNLGTASAAITLDNAGFLGGLAQAERALDRLGAAGRRVEGATAGVPGALRDVASAARDAGRAFADGVDPAFRFAGGVAAVGGAATLTAPALRDLADAMSRVNDLNKGSGGGGASGSTSGSKGGGGGFFSGWPSLLDIAAYAGGIEALLALGGRLKGVPWRTIFGDIRNYLRPLLPLFAGLGRALGPIVARLAGSAGLVALFGLLGPAIAALGPAGVIGIAAITLIAGGIYAWQNNTLGFRDALKDAWGIVRDIQDFFIGLQAGKWDPPPWMETFIGWVERLFGGGGGNMQTDTYGNEYTTGADGQEGSGPAVVESDTTIGPAPGHDYDQDGVEDINDPNPLDPNISTPQASAQTPLPSTTQPEAANPPVPLSLSELEEYNKLVKELNDFLPKFNDNLTLINNGIITIGLTMAQFNTNSLTLVNDGFIAVGLTMAQFNTNSLTLVNNGFIIVGNTMKQFNDNSLTLVNSGFQTYLGPTMDAFNSGPLTRVNAGFQTYLGPTMMAFNAGPLTTVNAGFQTYLGPTIQAFVTGPLTTLKTDLGLAGESFTTFQTTVSTAVSTLATNAESAFQRIQTAAETGINNATSAIERAAGKWPGIVAGLEGDMYRNGHTVGQAATEGVADGMRSLLGSVRAAANEIIYEVERAMNATAEVNSPSKLTARTGKNLTLGVVSGLGNKAAVRGATYKAKTVMGKVLDSMQPPKPKPTEQEKPKPEEFEYKLMRFQKLSGKGQYLEEYYKKVKVPKKPTTDPVANQPNTGSTKGGGSTTVINNHTTNTNNTQTTNALKGQELVRLIDGSEKGRSVHNTVKDGRSSSRAVSGRKAPVRSA